MTESQWQASGHPAEMLDFAAACGRLPARRARLVACAFVRHALLRLRSPEPVLLAQVLVAEDYSDGAASLEDLGAARSVASQLAGRPSVPGIMAFAVSRCMFPHDADAIESLKRASASILGQCDSERFIEFSLQQADAVRDILPHPLSAVPAADWLTTADVVSVARAAAMPGYGSGLTLDRDRLLVLADALEDAGCPQEAVGEVFIDCELCGGAGELSGSYFAEDGMEPCDACGGEGGRTELVTRPHPVLAHLRAGDARHYRGCWAVDLALGRQ